MCFSLGYVRHIYSLIYHLYKDFEINILISDFF